MSTIFRIAIPSPLRRLFDYLPPGNTAQIPTPGVRIRVPFGKRELIGVLIEITHTSELTPDKLKPALAILDQHPVLPDYLLQLSHWAADYYQHPTGDAICQTLPLYLRKGGEVDAALPEIWRAANSQNSTELPASAHKQQALWQLICEHPQGISRAAITAAGFNASQLRALAGKGLIETCSPHFIYPAPEHLLKEAPLTLNHEQAAAMTQLRQHQQGFSTFVLDGITGSGKTEIYLQAIQDALSQQKQALVLVPEIGLTPQLIKRFEHRFRTPVGVLHSGLSDKQRFLTWHQAGTGDLPVIIGTRSAIFTPLKNPGIIIVDEEHDGSFKQQEGFRYSARDLAVVRAHSDNIPLLLGSATPSLESLHNVAQGRYHLLRLRHRAGNARPPALHLLNIQQQALDNGFSTPLLQQMARHLQNGNQVLVFLNRRGFAPTLSCSQCGWLAECRRCDARLTLHKQPAHLHCHHCGHQQPIPRTCPQCSHSALQAVGAGTERAEDTLAQHFPNVPVFRIDRDSTSRKDALNQIIQEINKGQPCILVGTQMLAKGHHFPKVTLVAVPDADAGLFSADFRGMERTAQTIIQVAGRAGRGKDAGEVILQTLHADHPLLNTLVYQGYDAFAQAELAQRASFQLPPYQHLALLRAEAIQPGRAEAFLASIRAAYASQLSAEMLWQGPYPSPMERKAGVVRSQLLLSAQRRPLLQQTLSQLCRAMENHPNARQIRWSIDVDPYDLY